MGHPRPDPVQEFETFHVRQSLGLENTIFKNIVSNFYLFIILLMETNERLYRNVIKN